MYRYKGCCCLEGFEIGNYIALGFPIMHHPVKSYNHTTAESQRPIYTTPLVLYAHHGKTRQNRITVILVIVIYISDIKCLHYFRVTRDSFHALYSLIIMNLNFSKIMQHC